MREEEARLAEEKRLEAERTPPPPTYSQAELDAAKRQALEEGRQQGITEERERQDARKQQTLDAIAHALPALLEHEQERNRRYEIETLRLTEAIIKKLFPFFSAQYGLQELTHALEQILKQKTDAQTQTIEIILSPDQAGFIEEALKALPLGTAFHITPSETIASGSCKIRWKEGGAKHRPDQVCDEIYALLNKEIEENTTKSTPNPIEDSRAPQDCATMEADKEIKTAEDAQNVPINPADTPDDGDTQ